MEELDKDRAALGWFTAAWDDYLASLPAVLPVVLAQALASAGTFAIVHRAHSFLYALPYMFLVLTPLSLGVNLFYIRLTRGNGAFGDLFGAFPVYPRALAVSLLLGIASATGMLLLIIPGAVVYLTYAFSEYAVVDKRTGVRDSFNFSAALTYGWRTRLLPVFLLAGLVNFFVPDVYVISGPFKSPVAELDLKPWTLAAAALKTLVFLPWLGLAAARAYNFLLAPRPPDPGPEPGDD